MRAVLYVAFFLSGVAGLIYESIWSRYLGLFVGHTAYAQVIVLAIFLGGMALGALGVGQRSESVRRPLFWYAVAELGVGLYGIVFHDLFLALQELAYQRIFPILDGSAVLTPAAWGMVALLILPPSVLLGTTFPFMTAGFLRIFPRHPGQVLSLLYFSNSSGAALGALLSGFVLVGAYGLPGTVLRGAMLSMAAAILAWGVERRWARARPHVPPPAEEEPRVLEIPAPGLDQRALWRLLLAVSFGTAVASFIYEIAWIRMLSLVLGSATHAFELMLSAFILGLALGALWIRRRVDILGDPLRALGWIQWCMGAAALATLPLYVSSFTWTAELLSALNRTHGGYALFNLARYGIALVVMLPATFFAGMTLPLITRVLLGAGAGERAIGWVYGLNTVGSIVGVVVAALLLMPLIGLQPLLVLGGGLDLALGVALLTLRGRGREGGRATVGTGAALGASALVLLALLAVRLDRVVLTSGVYRTGNPGIQGTEILFYRDGRTATVSADRKGPEVLTLSTNGKPDATLDTRWLRPREGEGAVEPGPLELDAPTQALAPLVSLAYNPDARRALVVGQGSGLTSHMLLGSPALELLTTVEIEPAVLEASRVFLPATRRVFSDPRSRIRVADARTVLAPEGERLDLIISEPSNPWVSGVATLFTREFYGRVRERLAPGGIFGQWIHLYEISDELVLSVLSAIHESFPAYQIYLTHASDMLVVAGVDPLLPDPDWSVFSLPAVAEDLSLTYPFHPEILEATRFLDREALAPLLDDRVLPNSDFYPVLDLGTERTRFLQLPASGFLESAGGPFDLADALGPRPRETGETLLAPVPAIPAARALALRNRFRRWLQGGRRDLPAPGGVETSDPASTARALELRQTAYRWQRAGALVAMTDPPVDWTTWLREVAEGAGWGSTTGWRILDPSLLTEARAAAGRLGAPDGVDAALAFLLALEARDWEDLPVWAELLAREVVEGRRWIRPGVVLDSGIAAYLAGGKVEAAESLFRRLEPRSGRSPSDLRSQLLAAHLDRALSSR